MAEDLDPLGKRALYWRPVDAAPRQAGERRKQAATDGRRGATGKRALYSQAGGRPAGVKAVRKAEAPRVPNRTRMSLPREEAAADVLADPLRGQGPLLITCSSCGVETRVRVADFLFFLFPVPLLLPGRKFDRYMTCPSCRRRTWVGVTVSR